jgi:hypothetical protein
MANEHNVPYQSLIKMLLQERIEQDFKSRHLPKWKMNDVFICRRLPSGDSRRYNEQFWKELGF